MNKIYKIKPYFSERLWGGDKLKNYGFNIPSNNIGEAWIISAHENGMSYLEDKKISLKQFFEENYFKFNLTINDQYPLLVKIITANDYLSVQVHPNDDYAKKNHNSLGKPECWYIIDCPKNAKIIYGHNAKNKQQFEQDVNQGNWKSLLKEVEVNKGDFLYVEPGKIHAITPNVIVYELQRSSDITYRLYDYDRVDDMGNKRQLHINDALKNISIPDSQDVIIRGEKKLKFSCSYFSLEKLVVNHENSITWNKPKEIFWYQLTVLRGNCQINDIDFKMGESAICVDNLEQLNIKGDAQIIVSWI